MTIEDDGIGMVPELVGRVFDLFTQAERTSDRSSGGLGLGLALVKSIVELHGGTIACASPGQGLGSQFTVSLPRLSCVDQSVEPNPNSGHEIHGGKALNILIVDDNVDAAQMLAMYLDACGHESLVEHQSRRALERSRIEKPDVFLLDIGIPDMDSNELARHLRNQPETSKAVLIAVTGYGQEDDQRKAFAAGFDHHMVKPVDLARLSAVLAAVAPN